MKGLTMTGSDITSFPFPFTSLALFLLLEEPAAGASGRGVPWDFKSLVALLSVEIFGAFEVLGTDGVFTSFEALGTIAGAGVFFVFLSETTAGGGARGTLLFLRSLDFRVG
jgi:hypothetical protein